MHMQSRYTRNQSAARIRTPESKRAARRPPCLKSDAARSFCRGGFFFLLGRLDGAGIAALRIHVAIDELDDGARGVVAVAETRLHDPGVAAVALLVARAEHLEELLDLGDVAHFRDRLAAGGKAALLGERDQLLDHRAQFLGLRQGRDDLLVLDQRRAHVREHGLAVRSILAKLAVSISVTHRTDPLLLCVTTARRTLYSGGLPAFASKSRPYWRPRPKRAQ